MRIANSALIFATAVIWLTSASERAHAASLFEDESRQCGNESVWIQILGAGGPELNDQQGSASYVVWLDNHARLLIDPASGSASQFDQSGAKLEDLDAIVFTQLGAAQTADFPAFLQGAKDAASPLLRSQISNLPPDVEQPKVNQREKSLPVLGPDAQPPQLDTKTFINRLIGPKGAYPALADFLTFKSAAGFKLSVRNVPSTGRRRWSRFGSEHFRLAAIPVNHAEVPALAWRVEIGGFSIVFTGNFNNGKDVVAKFAAGADALVIHHAIPETTRGSARERFVTPGQIGTIAAKAEVRMLILGHRTNRTRGRESQTRTAIEENYQGPLIFANDLECWGL